mmetsp:Transcript_22325/g.69726  ORF Transcript_22325/g.69726 Transcript_22325/m.69726 type:complete len:200 (+) Transcript_22325:115-714(+)
MCRPVGPVDLQPSFSRSENGDSAICTPVIAEPLRALWMEGDTERGPAGRGGGLAPGDHDLAPPHMIGDPMGDVSGDASNLTPVPPTANAPPRTTSPEGVSAPEGLQAKEEAQDRETMTQPPSHMTDDSMGAVSGEASDPTPLPLMPETRTPTGSPTGNAAGEDPGALTARIDHLPLASASTLQCEPSALLSVDGTGAAA